MIKPFWVRDVGENVHPQKAHLHPLRSVCVQYIQRHPSTGFQDLLRKRNTKRRTYVRTDTRDDAINTPLPMSGRLERKVQLTFFRLPILFTITTTLNVEFFVFKLYYNCTDV